MIVLLYLRVSTGRRLRSKVIIEKSLSAVVSSGARIPVEDGFDRILSSKVDAFAQIHQARTRQLTVWLRRAHPKGPQVMKLCEVGLRQVCLFRSRATGQAVRILTGAILPDGVDTVVLEKTAPLSLTNRLQWPGNSGQILVRPVKMSLLVRQSSKPADIVSTDLSLLASQGLIKSMCILDFELGFIDR